MNTKNPIVLIPGIGGSKLMAISKNNTELAWVNPSTKIFSKMSQYLWGSYNP